MEQLITKILEALAVGDAVGMPTEFMTRDSIVNSFGIIDTLLLPQQSQNHSNLKFASVTDDTEQNFYLIKKYCESGKIDIKETAECLLAWVDETDAVGKKYIGPSSLKALQLIEKGEDPAKTGIFGTTCGGIMRTPAAVLCSRASTNEALARDIVNCCMPTHYTSTALEAAVGYGFALNTALNLSDINQITEAAIEGAITGKGLAPYVMCAASGAERLKYINKLIPGFTNENELLDFLYNIFGTGLESEDIFAAVMAIFLYARGDVWLAIRMGASLGGDTDTVACLAGTLTAAYSKGHNIPAHILKNVKEQNSLEFQQLAKLIIVHRNTMG